MILLNCGFSLQLQVKSFHSWSVNRLQAQCVPPRPWHFAFESWQQGGERPDIGLGQPKVQHVVPWHVACLQTFFVDTYFYVNWGTFVGDINWLEGRLLESCWSPVGVLLECAGRTYLPPTLQAMGKPGAKISWRWTVKERKHNEEVVGLNKTDEQWRTLSVNCAVLNPKFWTKRVQAFLLQFSWFKWFTFFSIFGQFSCLSQWDLGTLLQILAAVATLASKGSLWCLDHLQPLRIRLAYRWLISAITMSLGYELQSRHNLFALQHCEQFPDTCITSRLSIWVESLVEYFCWMKDLKLLLLLLFSLYLPRLLGFDRSVLLS